MSDYKTNTMWQGADNLARSTYPTQLGNATVERVDSQVVSGMNYKTMYRNGKDLYEVVVYSQPWTNTLKIT